MKAGKKAAAGAAALSAVAMATLMGAQPAAAVEGDVEVICCLTDPGGGGSNLFSKFNAFNKIGNISLKYDGGFPGKALDVFQKFIPPNPI